MITFFDELISMHPFFFLKKETKKDKYALSITFNILMSCMYTPFLFLDMPVCKHEPKLACFLYVLKPCHACIEVLFLVHI